MKKKTNTYTSHDIQNEVLHIVALGILRDVSKSISYTEQLVVCIRWVDELLQDLENVIGVYNVGTIDAKTLTDALEDVLLRAGLKIHNCRGQCYDGAANMSGSKTGVQSHFLQRESRALFTHCCFGHSLNLAVGDALKNNKVCRDALDVAFEVSKLIHFSP